MFLGLPAKLNRLKPTVVPSETSNHSGTGRYSTRALSLYCDESITRSDSPHELVNQGYEIRNRRNKRIIVDRRNELSMAVVERTPGSTHLWQLDRGRRVGRFFRPLLLVLVGHRRRICVTVAYDGVAIHRNNVDRKSWQAAHSANTLLGVDRRLRLAGAMEPYPDRGCRSAEYLAPNRIGIVL